MKAKLVARNTQIHSYFTPRLATRAALFAAGLALSSLSVASAQGGTSSPGACAHTEPVEGIIEDISLVTCTCAGPGPVFVPPVTIGGITIGTSTPGPDPDDILCPTFIIHASYDKSVPGGETTVIPGDFINDILVESKCDTSNCGRALGFLWRYGDAECDLTLTDLPGGHQTYKQTGQLCVSWKGMDTTSFVPSIGLRPEIGRQ